MITEKDQVPGFEAIELEYDIAEFKVTSYSFREPEFKMAPGTPIRYDTGIGTWVSEDAKTIEIEIRAELRRFEDAIEIPYILEITTSTLFALSGLDDQVIKQGVVFLPVHFVSRLVEISLDTTRGILIAKNVGTHYEKVLLPTVESDMLGPHNDENGKYKLMGFSLKKGKRLRNLEEIIKTGRRRAIKVDLTKSGVGKKVES
jgi:hypothetical protein